MISTAEYITVWDGRVVSDPLDYVFDDTMFVWSHIDLIFTHTTHPHIENQIEVQ